VRREDALVDARVEPEIVCVDDQPNHCAPEAFLLGNAVTSGGKRHVLPDPFFVLATQNPIEQEGTYPLPEAQLDRFMFLVQVGYPSLDEEREILRALMDERGAEDGRN
jgi:MoxR-like ATPase